jgi:hypothetical protein
MVGGTYVLLNRLFGIEVHAVLQSPELTPPSVGHMNFGGCELSEGSCTGA